MVVRGTEYEESNCNYLHKLTTGCKLFNNSSALYEKFTIPFRSDDCTLWSKHFIHRRTC